MPAEIIEIDEFVTLTVGIVVYFAGVAATRRVAFLRDYNVPEAVTGGLFAAIAAFAVFLAADVSINFDLEGRDRLLIYFFVAIGLNARISDLIKGGRPLLILLALTIGFIVVQNSVGAMGAAIFQMPDAVGVLAGSASLIGGHGTAIAWAPEIAELHNVPNALEIGVASATFGLILASLIGGPIAKFLIERGGLKAESGGDSIVGLSYQSEGTAAINHMTLMGVILAMHIAIILGYLFNELLAAAGFKLPLFVACLLAAIAMSNIIPKLFPRLPWPARTPALAVVSDYSLNIFLAMSLMSMKLWTLAGLAGPLFVILFLQTAAAILFILLIVFRAMGKNYEAAVLCAGFGGVTLGATPTALANMTAVAKKHGPAPNAFIILPLISAFFIDIANAFVIRAFLN